MFGSKKQEDKTISTSRSTNAVLSDSNALNSLVKGTFIEGHLSAESDIRVDGTIKGTLVCQAKVIIGPSGIIEGEINCQNAVIEGKFFGKLHVADMLSVKESAEIIGEVHTDKLMVQAGAIFNVTCNMKLVNSTDNVIHILPEKLETENGVNRK